MPTGPAIAPIAAPAAPAAAPPTPSAATLPAVASSRPCRTSPVSRVSILGLRVELGQTKHMGQSRDQTPCYPPTPVPGGLWQAFRPRRTFALPTETIPG